MGKYIEILPHNIDSRRISDVIKVLKKGGIVIIPTDSIYAIVGDLYQKDVMEKICKLIGQKPNKANLSILCKNLSHLSEYTSHIPNPTYKLMNSLFPGPFTFILKASNKIPTIFRRNKKTIGIRVPNNEIAQAIISELGNPLVSTSIHAEDEIQKYLTEPEEIFETWKDKVDLIVDGGAGQNVGTTVIDATGDEMEIIREGLGFEMIQ